MIDEVQFHFDNLAKHEVATFEAEEALYDGWAARRRQGVSKNGHPEYEVLGSTSEGRHLHLICEVFKVTDPYSGETKITLRVVRIFHGRDMGDSERRRYGKN
jgi:hypothetical protein